MPAILRRTSSSGEDSC
ncbi:hypothetical protein C359_01914 [Cryptococcus neoformans Bt120]|nr:hypothetical protein C359_01914 [Cryptococcus neoformans var. grubii Bt120]